MIRTTISNGRYKRRNGVEGELKKLIGTLVLRHPILDGSEVTHEVMKAHNKTNDPRERWLLANSGCINTANRKLRIQEREVIMPVGQIDWMFPSGTKAVHEYSNKELWEHLLSSRSSAAQLLVEISVQVSTQMAQDGEAIWEMGKFPKMRRTIKRKFIAQIGHNGNRIYYAARDELKRMLREYAYLKY